MEQMTTSSDERKPVSACIAIPTHKKFENLSVNEVVSLTQCVKVLRKYPVIFAGPESIDWSGYKAFCDRLHIPFRAVNFSNHFFASPEGYNKMLITVEFYEPFAEFEYMLLFQTDCFIFRDELAYWCNKGFDYVGAPWVGADMFAWFLMNPHPTELLNVHRFFKNRSLRRTGNGGLSLRNTASMLKNLKRFRKAADNWNAFEDSFISHYIGTFNPFFRIPWMKTALKFSFDANPQQAYVMNNHQLPFACHAWFRNEKPHYEHNLAFWLPFVKQYTVA
jgi:hypothetical protein